jgi:hypothetical protein
MENNISTWFRVYLENLLHAATYSLETYPLATSLILILLHLLSIVGVGWIVSRLLAASESKKAEVGRSKASINDSRAGFKASTR